jgi:phospholipid/cholesterol/gamma-HCH transport system substrate-binding protein
MKAVSAGVKVGILFVLLAAGAYLVWKNLHQDLAGDDSYWLKAKFRDASGLPVGSKVVVAGLPVGEITSLDPEGRFAVIKFRLKDQVTVWTSAVVYKKATSLLGNYYLEVDPGEEKTATPEGEPVIHTKLKEGDEIKKVVEATSPDELLRRIAETLPNVDAVLLNIRDLTSDVRRLVNGPLSSIATRVETLVEKEAPVVSGIIAKADRAMDRIDDITKNIDTLVERGDDRVDNILKNLEDASAEAKALVATANKEIEAVGASVRDKLDKVDKIIANTEQITDKVNEGEGTLAQLVNRPEIGENVEEITDDARGFLGTIFNLQAYVGLRSEFNYFSKLTRHYISVELHTRPDKYYLIELEKGPRGDYPDVTLTMDPTVDPDNWIRKSVIEDKIRFTFQFAKRFNWLTLRYGLKESTGGIGADADVKWFNKKMRLSLDVFDATFDQLPRVKLTAAAEVLRHLYILGGVDELINNPDTLTITTGNDDVPIQFEEFRFGRDYFLGAMLRFNDQDLAALLAVGGSAVGGVAGGD